MAALIGLGSLGVAETASAQRFEIDFDRPQVRARVRIGARVAPPARRFEVRPAAPQYGMVWQPGYWDWNGRQHVWVQGRWVQERRGYTWQEPRWENRGREGWVLVPGTWVAVPSAPSYPPPPAYGTPTYPSTPGFDMPDRSRAYRLPRGAAYGEPARYHTVRGQRAAYWVWIDNQGLFHIHAASNQPRDFRGRIVSDDGGVVSLVRRTGVDTDDTTVQTGRGLRFDWTTAGGQDGIAFAVQGGRCARLQLTSERSDDPRYSTGYDDRRDRGFRQGRGSRREQRIYIGRNQIQVRSNHLVICR